MPRDDFHRAFQAQCAQVAHLYGTAYTSLELEVGTETAQALAAAVLPGMVQRCAEAASVDQNRQVVMQSIAFPEMW